MDTTFFTEAEWDLIFRSCDAIQVTDCMPPYLKDFIALRLIQVEPDLARKIWQLEDAQMQEVCCVVREHQQAKERARQRSRDPDPLDPADPPQSDKTVLIVDDNADIRYSLSLLLKLQGYHSTAVAHGQEALDYLRNNPPPCLIVLDLMMPVMDGWEFRQAQKQDPSLADIPVVVCSAAGDIYKSPDFEDALGYYKKPVDPEQLAEQVRRCCA